MPRFWTPTLTIPTLIVLLAACHEGESPADALMRGGLTAPSIEGRFEMRIASMDDGTARRSYHVRTFDGTKDLVTDEEFDLPYNTFVRAWGEHEDEYAFALDELEVLGPPAVPLIDPEPYPYRRIATVIVFWNQQGLGNEQAKLDMFIDADSTNVFYGENSYGKETIAGDVFGPYQIDDPGSCNPGFIADRGLQQFIENGHDPDEYRQFMWHFPQMGDCGFGGLASVGSVADPARDSWYNGNFGCVVRAQEIGHNYGMGHSHSWNCPVDTLLPTDAIDCTHVEYGDPHDPMGGGCDHMNVTQKAYMGWLEECNIVTTQSSGTFNVLPTELPCNGTQALRFSSGDDRFYYVEYRRPLGVDEGYEGVLLHESSDHDYSPSPYILEAATDEDGGTSYFMQPGDSFTDPEDDVSFTVVEMLDTHAVIEVTFPGGGGGEPTCQGGGAPEMAAGAVGSLECDDEPFPLDVSPPTVEITYPADGDVFPIGADFTITAEAMDDRYVTEAELYLQIIGTDDEPQPLFKLFDAPYEYDVTNIPEGEYLFGFVVRDGPNQGISEPVLIEVREIEDADTSGSGTSPEETSTGDEPDETTGDLDDSSSGEPEQDGPQAEGCGCDTQGGDTGGLALAGLVVVGGLVRRRRR
jgi:MYXO-CTERM domain-containing protein